MLTETLEWVRDQLADSGLSVDLDPRNLNLPGVWITPDTVQQLQSLGGRSSAVTVSLVLVAADTGQPSALAQLDQLLHAVAAAPAVIPEPTWEAVSIRLPNHSPEPLPALRGTVTLDWSA